jgi:hypothetical protein
LSRISLFFAKPSFATTLAAPPGDASKFGGGDFGGGGSDSDF